MRQLLINAFKQTVGQIEQDLPQTPLDLWNESVFRFQYSLAITNQNGGVKQFAECQRIDLVLHHESERAFVEFKFYIRAARHDLFTG